MLQWQWKDVFPTAQQAWQGAAPSALLWASCVPLFSVCLRRGCWEVLQIPGLPQLCLPQLLCCSS